MKAFDVGDFIGVLNGSIKFYQANYDDRRDTVQFFKHLLSDGSDRMVLARSVGNIVNLMKNLPVDRTI